MMFAEREYVKCGRKRWKIVKEPLSRPSDRDSTQIFLLFSIICLVLSVFISSPSSDVISAYVAEEKQPACVQQTLKWDRASDGNEKTIPFDNAFNNSFLFLSLFRVFYIISLFIVAVRRETHRRGIKNTFMGFLPLLIEIKQWMIEEATRMSNAENTHAHHGKVHDETKFVHRLDGRRLKSTTMQRKAGRQTSK